MFIDTKQSHTIVNAQPIPAKSETALDVAHLIGIVWTRRWRVFLAIVMCIVAALLFGQFMPARFTAVMQILVDPNDLRVVENGLRGQNTLTETHITQVENQVRVLTSQNVIKRVVERLSLDRDPEFLAPGFPDLRRTVRDLFGMRSAGQRDATLDALNALKDRIRAKRIDRTYVVDTSVRASSPEQAVQIANMLLESFMEEQSFARAEASRRASGSLNARLVELRTRVQEAEQRVEGYKRANHIISSSGTPVNERQITELNSQLVLARTRTAEAKSRYDKVREIQRSRTDPGAIGEAVSSATITALRTQLAEILRREGEITATLGSRHPAVIEIQSQVRGIRRLIDEELNRIGEAARNELERATANERSLAASLERLKSNLEDTNDASVRLRELERDVQASRTVYEAYLVRTREVSEQEQLDTTNIRVIASPELPETRSFPPRTLTLLAAGGILGGMLGVGLAFLAEWRDRRAPALPKPPETHVDDDKTVAPPQVLTPAPMRTVPSAPPAPSTPRSPLGQLPPVPDRGPPSEIATSTQAVPVTRISEKPGFRL